MSSGWRDLTHFPCSLIALSVGTIDETRCFVMTLRNHVDVDLLGDLIRRVTEHLLNLFPVDAQRSSDRRCGVSERMRSDARQSSFLARRVHESVEIARIDEFAEWTREHEIVLLPRWAQLDAVLVLPLSMRRKLVNARDRCNSG